LLSHIELPSQLVSQPLAQLALLYLIPRHLAVLELFTCESIGNEPTLGQLPEQRGERSTFQRQLSNIAALEHSLREPAEMRRSVGNGMRQINLLLIPAAAFSLVLSKPITRLVYQHGNFGALENHRVSVALFWFAFSLPFGGINLLLTRTFFALQRPWIPTRYAAMNMVVDIIVSIALYQPLGIAGLVIGTAVANAVMTFLLFRRLTQGFDGRLEGPQTLMITVRILLASVIMAAVARLVWTLCEGVLGASLVAQIIAVGLAVAAATAVYARTILSMRVPEARQIQALVLSRLGRG